MGRFSQLCALILGLALFCPLMERAHANTPDYAFVIFETAVTRQGVETDDDHPEEQRVYISNVVAFPEADPSVFRSAMKLADDYFVATVVDPMKAKGILHHYYDDGIRINDKLIYELNTRDAVEALRNKVLQDYKGRNNNVFTFNWTRTKNLNGLETSHPTLYYHNPEQPLYEPETVPPTATPPALTPPVAQTPPVALVSPPAPPAPTPTPKPTALKKPTVSKPKVAPKPVATAKPKPKPTKSQTKTKPAVKKRPVKKPA